MCSSDVFAIGIAGTEDRLGLLFFRGEINVSSRLEKINVLIDWTKYCERSKGTWLRTGSSTRHDIRISLMFRNS